MLDLLIKGGLVATFDSQWRTIPDGAVAIRGSSIVDIGPAGDLASRYQAKRVLDATGKFIMPGLVCAHAHMPTVLGHNMPVDFSQFHDFMDLLTKWWWPQIEDQTTNEDIYWATLYSSIKMLKAGTTTVADMVEAPYALPGCLDWSARAVDESGIRALIAYEVTDRIDEENGHLGVQENLRFVKEWNQKPGRVRGAFALHTVDTCSEARLREVRKLASDHGAHIFIHVAEIPPPITEARWGKRAPYVMRDVGLLAPDVLAVHCIHLTPEEIDLMAAANVKVAHTPMSNMLGGNGVAPIPDMLDKGMSVGLGHDCFFTLDTFDYLRTMYLVHKVHRQNPGVLPPPQALAMVSTMGARALGMDRDIGSLETGKKADVIIVDPRGPAPLTPQTFMGYAIMDVNGADVQTVVVDGRVVVEGRRVLTVDEGEVLRQCVSRAEALWRRAGAIS
ncbi:MAG: amidohydrolase [Bacillota bacterium]